MQSNNSFLDHESCGDKAGAGDADERLQNIPSLDTNGENILNVNASNSVASHLVSLRSNGTANNLDPARRGGLLGEAGLDDDDDLDDTASRVSDITEDRTQRQIDDDLAERRKILLAYVNKAHHSTASLSHASTQRRLETIENMIPAGGTDAAHTADAAGPGAAAGRPGRLSVAQRARLAADGRSNHHRSPSPTARAAGEAPLGGSGSRSGESPPQPPQPQPQSQSHPHPPASGRRRAPVVLRQAPSADSSSGGDTPSSRGETVSRSGSFWTRVGTALEKAVDNSVLGVPVGDSEAGGDDSYLEECASDVATSVASEASTTLTERIAMQRERQVTFLKNKGLIHDDGASLRRGGAGGSVTGGAGYAASPACKTPPQRALASASFATRWSPRRMGVARDEA